MHVPTAAVWAAWTRSAYVKCLSSGRAVRYWWSFLLGQKNPCSQSSFPLMHRTGKLRGSQSCVLSYYCPEMSAPLLFLVRGRQTFPSVSSAVWELPFLADYFCPEVNSFKLSPAAFARSFQLASFCIPISLQVTITGNYSSNKDDCKNECSCLSLL